MAQTSRDGEVERLRQTALEFRARLRKRSLSVDSIWNAAVYECMALVGPACGLSHGVQECQRCWIHHKLRGALRLEASVYVPLKERMNNSLERMRQTCTLKGPEYAYIQALEDIENEVAQFMDDNE